MSCAADDRRRAHGRVQLSRRRWIRCRQGEGRTAVQRGRCRVVSCAADDRRRARWRGQLPPWRRRSSSRRGDVVQHGLDVLPLVPPHGIVVG